MITHFWEIVSQVVTGYIDILVDAFNGVTEVFYNSTDGFTVLGQLLLIALGVAVVAFAITFIIRLIRK